MAKIANIGMFEKKHIRKMTALLKPLLWILQRSESLRKLCLEILRYCVNKTDNDVDNSLVDLLETKLFPVKWNR